jgi:hypothetical protein
MELVENKFVKTLHTNSPNEKTLSLEDGGMGNREWI